MGNNDLSWGDLSLPILNESEKRSIRNDWIEGINNREQVVYYPTPRPPASTPIDYGGDDD